MPWAPLVLLLPLFALSAEDVRINAQTLSAQPAGWRVDASVKATRDGLDFSKGGITLPTGPWLTATQGLVDVTCQMPPDWPVSGDRPLFNARSESHVHATLFFRDGCLTAVYKGGEAHFSSIAVSAAQAWLPGSWHRLQFSWRLAEDKAAFPGEVEFLLHVDGQLAESAYGRLMEPWPATCEIGTRNNISWQGLLRDVILSATPLVPPEMAPGERTITVKADQALGECTRFWTVANCNGPHRFLNPKYADGLSKGQPFIRQINAVYVLGGRYPDQNTFYQGVAPDGTIQADFSGLVAQLQAMLDGGFTPWIVLDNTPYPMSHPPQENTYGNTAPPDDERIWAQYVEAAVRAMVEAFGRETVGRWWFRVGTEPDLMPGHWAGTKEQYFAHYDHTVAAVARVLPEAQIGPGNILNPRDGQFGTNTRGKWGLDIIDHVAQGTNAVTGRIGTRMDWFSCSWYARVGRPLSDFDDAVNLMRTRLARYPQLSQTPLVIGEFTVLHDESGHRLWGCDTTEWAASFYAGLADRVYRYGIRQVYEWSQTTEGILHPRTQVIAMLDRMADGQRVETAVRASSAADCGAIACRKGDDLYILLYNHRARRRPSVPETVHLVVHDDRMRKGAAWQLSETLVDATHASWAYAFAADCRTAGVKPLPQAGRYEGGVSFLYGPPGVEIFRKNREKYALLAQPAETSEPVSVGRGRLERDIEMEGHSVRLIRLSPPVSVDSPKKRSSLWDYFGGLLH